MRRDLGIDRVVVIPPDGLEELSRAYVERRRDAMGQLWSDLEARNYDQICRIAHDVKGTGASYGLPSLTGIARLLEQAASERAKSRVEHALTLMTSYLAAVQFESSDQRET